ncbi:MAG: glycosyltransferase family 4 protein [Solirubrobacterales bacterium]|nr:glycosyltransferase family 4 protein [Solirubrobacterales bacterium]
MGEGKLELYRWADVLALPSRYPPEGQPLVLLEAMSAGLAIIGSDHSGIPHTVIDGEHGLIVPKGDVEALAEAIDRLRTDRELLARLGAAGRERFDDRYAVPAYERRVEALLLERGMA